MNKTSGLFLPCLFLLAGSSLRAGMGPGFDAATDEYGVEVSTVTKDNGPSAFARAAARKLDFPLEQLKKMEKAGFGRSEMLALVLISRESSKMKWEDLLKAREEGRALRDLAADNGLAYNDVFRRSMVVKNEIAGEASLEISTEPVPSIKTNPPLHSH